MEPEKKKLNRWIVGILCAVFLGGGFLTLLVGTFVHFFVLLPWNTYESINGKDWKHLNARAYTFTHVQDFLTAEQTLKAYSVHKTYKHNPIPFFLLASLYETMNRKEDAIQSYQKAISTVKSSSNAWYDEVLYEYFLEDAHSALSLLYYQTHQTEKASEALLSIKNLEGQTNPEMLEALQNVLDEPDRADFHYQLGLELRHNLKLAEARQEFEQAIRLSTDPTLKLEAQNYLKMKMPHREKNVSPLAVYYSLAGDAVEEKGEDLAQAATFYQQAIQESPGFEWPYYNLGLVYRELNDTHKSIEYAEKALKINPDFVLPYITLGEVSLDQSNYQQAAEYFNKALALSNQLSSEDDEDKSVLANIENQLAYTYEEMKNHTLAMSHYQKVMELSEDGSEDYQYAEDAVIRIRDEVEKKAIAVR